MVAATLGAFLRDVAPMRGAISKGLSTSTIAVRGFSAGAPDRQAIHLLGAILVAAMAGCTFGCNSGPDSATGASSTSSSSTASTGSMANGFCARTAPSAVYCNDFDEGSSPGVAIHGDGMAHLDPTTSTSAPASLQVSAGFNGQLAGGAYFQAGGPTTHPAATLEFDLRPHAVDVSTGQLVSLTVLGVETIDLGLQGQSLILQESTKTIGPVTPVAGTLPLDTWTHVRLHWGVGMLQIETGGTVQYATKPMADPTPGQIALQMGLLFVGSTQPSVVNFDNVVLTDTP